MTNVKTLQRFVVSLCLLASAELSYARHAAIIVDANTGNVLQQVDAHQAWYPASLTKVMTLYMAFDALKTGRLHMDDLLTVSSHAAQQKPSKLGLRAWDRISVQEAILAVITRSANDAAVVLGEAIGGNEYRFASLMTQQAHELNMSHSHFMNATGLPHDQQVTTAHDMAVLAWRVQRDFPEYYRLFSTHNFYFNGREYRSTNKFVASYPGAEGMKTGYTCGSGHNLIATAQQNGNRLIGVVLGGMTSGERYDLMYDLMDSGFAQFSGYASSYGTGSHINNSPSGSAGAPPYQLDCGDRPESPYVYQGAPSKNWTAKADVLAEPTYIKKSNRSDFNDTSNHNWSTRTHTLSYQVATRKSLMPTSSANYNQAEWAVDLGEFHTQVAAENINKKAGIQLAQTLTPGRPLVVKKQSFNREERWHALWSGYTSIYAAGDVCKALWQQNIRCTVSHPEGLTPRQTAFR